VPRKIIDMQGAVALNAARPVVLAPREA